MIIKILKSIKPIGFRGHSIFDVGKFFIKGIMKGSITTRASSLAFNFFLAFFPSIIVCFSLIPFIPINNFQETLINIITGLFPPSTNNAVFLTLEDIINNPRDGLLSIGFFLALFFSSNGVNSLIEAFNSSYHIKNTRSIFKQRFISLVLTIILSILIFISICLIIFGRTLAKYIVNTKIINTNAENLILAGEWVVLIILLFSGITILFYYGPSSKKELSKIVNPGAIFSTFFIILTSIIYSYFVSNFSLYNKFYGSIGTLLIILIWIYTNSIILLTGFELNASISNAKKKLNSNRDL